MPIRMKMPTRRTSPTKTLNDATKRDTPAPCTQAAWMHTPGWDAPNAWRDSHWHVKPSDRPRLIDNGNPGVSRP
jgi:hypothetical protein